MSVSNYEEHARAAAESKFHDTVINVEDKSRTNGVIIVDLNRSSKKKVKYHTFQWHSTAKFLGGVYAQKYLANITDVVPTVHGIYQEDPLETVRTSWYITEYSEGDTIEVFHPEDYTKNTATEIAASLGETLAKMHNGTFSADVDFPVGQIRKKRENGFQSTEDNWKEIIQSIAQSRYNSYDPHHSPIDKETVSELFTTVSQNIYDTIPNEITPVLSNLDYRPGNAAFSNLHTTDKPTTIEGIFDWDRAMYGDWQYGLAIGEFFLINTAQHEQNRLQMQKAYRNSYMNTLDYDVNLDIDAYRSYIGMQYLQQCRSFEFWYKDRTEEWLDSQRVLTENHINKLLNGDLVPDL